MQNLINFQLDFLLHKWKASAVMFWLMVEEKKKGGGTADENPMVETYVQCNSSQLMLTFASNTI